MNTHKTLFVMRAAPASGKSTLAHMIYSQYINNGATASIRSTDDQFIDGGVYKFDRSLIGCNHAKNLALATEDMKNGINAVIIDNTNINTSDYKSYVDVAQVYGYEVQIIKVTVDLGVCLKRNATRTPDRKIPDDVIIRMHESLKNKP